MPAFCGHTSTLFLANPTAGRCLPDDKHARAVKKNDGDDDEQDDARSENA
jgi:hypothetical protein